MKIIYKSIIILVWFFCTTLKTNAQCGVMGKESEELPFYFGQNEVLDSILKITNKNLK